MKILLIVASALMTKNLILTQSRMMVARNQRRMAFLKGRSMRGAGYKFRGSIFNQFHDLNIYKRMDRTTHGQLFSGIYSQLGDEVPGKIIRAGRAPCAYYFSEGVGILPARNFLPQAESRRCRTYLSARA
jgi:hypothetical protein